jgi:hypothetical protein
VHGRQQRCDTSRCGAQIIPAGVRIGRGLAELLPGLGLHNVVAEGKTSSLASVDAGEEMAP